MVQCPFCQYQNEDGALFCEQCKSDLSAVPAAAGAAPAMAMEAAPAMAAPVDMGARAGPPNLARAQAAKTAAQARLAQLDLSERLGQLLPLEEAQEAARNVAARLRRGVEQMPSRAEEVASSLAKDSPFARTFLAALRADPQGARAFFRALAREQLAELGRMATAFEDHNAGDTNGASVGVASGIPVHA